MKKSMVTAGLVAAACTMATESRAQGGLLGETVNVSAFYDSITNPWTDPGKVVVVDAVEYPAGSYPNYNMSWEVDVSDTQVSIRDTAGTGLPFSPSPIFNGFILEVLTGPTPVSASVNPASNLIPIAVSVEGNRVLMNFSGVSQPDLGAAIIDIEFESDCYPDCDGDSLLTIDDFICYQTFFALGDPYADCDGDSSLTIDDFICYQTLFAIGC